MKAVRMHESGGGEKFLYEDAPDPEVGHNDVLGSDVAGVVEGHGDAVTGVELGSEVMLQPAIRCGNCQACLEGRDNLCPNYSILGQRFDGGLAELISVPVVNLISKPDNLSFEEAAAVPLTFVTAWHMLVTRAGVQRGETVLVNAAGSGVGVAAIQMAKLFGARVIASAGSDGKLEKARQLGADETINYTTSDLADEARRLTGSRGVDLAVENVGSHIF